MLSPPVRSTGRPGLGAETPLGLVVRLLTAAAVVGSAAVGGAIPSPFDATDVVPAYLQDERDPAPAAAGVHLLSVLPILLVGCRLAFRLGRGGVACEGAMLVLASGAATGAFAVLAGGGPLLAVMVGVFCLTVVFSTRSSGAQLPAALDRAGILVSGTGLLAGLALVWPSLTWLVPVARLCGLGWLAVVAVAPGRIPAPLAQRPGSA
jgi:hypothetical protein